MNSKQLDNISIQDEKNTTWLEHEKLEYIIYPYELTFNQLKDSAILFLDLYLNALEDLMILLMHQLIIFNSKITILYL